MAIDVATRQSPGWWMQRLSNQMMDRKRQQRLALLQSYYDGCPPLPEGALNARSAYAAFQKKARTNFAELIVESVRSKMQVRNIRTAVAGDEAGDQLAMQWWRANSMPVRMMDVWGWMFNLGEAYMAVGLPAKTTEGVASVPVMTQEHPTQCITEHDPITGREIAGLKLFHDDVEQVDFCYLWLPGERHVAVRQNSGRRLKQARFSAESFVMDDDRHQEWNGDTLPLLRFRNRNGKGLYEGHTDLLDRINHMVLQRMVIATFQAFKQRAIKVAPEDLPKTDPDTGLDIDYDAVFAADPGALWRLPQTADLWESGQVDLQPILSSVKDDVLHLSAVTRTPLTMFTPDAATQTAEGAQLQREGQTSVVEDSHTLGGDHLARLYEVGFAMVGDTDRADASKISIDWRPAVRYSLAEAAAGGVQAAQAGMPWRSRMEDIFQYSPDDIPGLDAERMDDATFAQITGIAQAQTPPLPNLASTADRLAKATDHVA